MRVRAFSGAAKTVSLTWFDYGLKGTYSVVNGVPQIFWAGNGNVWKCAMGLYHKLTPIPPSFGAPVIKNWYDGLTHDNVALSSKDSPTEEEEEEAVQAEEDEASDVPTAFASF